MPTDVLTDFDSLYITNVISHLQTLLLVAPPPDEEVHSIYERVLNNLIRGDQVHALDLEALVAHQKTCSKAATPLLESDTDVNVSTMAPEFRALVHYHLASLLESVCAFRVTDEEPLKDKARMEAAASQQWLHVTLFPALMGVVREFFESKIQNTDEQVSERKPVT